MPSNDAGVGSNFRYRSCFGERRPNEGADRAQGANRALTKRIATRRSATFRLVIKNDDAQVLARIAGLCPYND